MVRITTAMAAISREALTWYAQLLDSGRSEFTAADFPEVPERTLRWYIGQIRTGWCNIQVVRRGRGDIPTVYGMPATGAGATPAENVASDRQAATVFAVAWAARAEAAGAPLSAADYLSLRAMVPTDVPTERFDRALTSKLLELSTAELMANAKPSRRLAWLRAGVARTLASMPTGAPASVPESSPASPVTGISREEAEYQAYAKKVMSTWTPPWERFGETPNPPPDMRPLPDPLAELRQQIEASTPPDPTSNAPSSAAAAEGAE